MSAGCAEWPRLAPLVARRLERAAAGEAESALASPAFGHLETCPSCRRAAVTLDPTLALRALAAAAEGAPAGDEVEAMRLAVETLRCSRRSERRGGVRSAWWKTAAAAVLAAGALYQLPGAVPRAPAGRAQVDPLLEALASRPVTPGVVPAYLSSLPMVEELDRPDARVYQLGGGDVSVVMIVDETLDV